MSTNRYPNHGRYLMRSPSSSNKQPQHNTLLSTQDRTLNFPLDFKSFKIKAIFSKGTEEFLNCNQQLKNKIGSYLITMIEQICSISFNLMKEEKLTEKMMKNYASKNMLENIKYFCSGLSKRIKEEYQKSLRFHQNQNEYYQTVNYISKKRDIAEYTKLQQGQKRGTQRYLASREKYVGQTPRSNSKIESFVSIERNLRSARRSDKPTKPNINIEELIIGVMEYINETLVNIVKQIGLKYLIVPPNNCSKQLKEAIQKIDFRQDYSQEFLHKSGQVIKRVADKTKEEMHDTFTGGIMKFMNNVIELSQGPNDGETYLTSFKRFNQKLVHVVTQPKEGDILPWLRYLSEEEERNVDLLKPQIAQRYLAGSKVQKNIPKFQTSQIQNAEFENKNSALLRILTKWIEDILETFEKSDKYIKDNGFKFKDNDNQLIYLNERQRKVLNEQMRQAYKAMNWQVKSQKNTFVSILLKEEEFDEVKYMYEGSLRLASKLNKYIAKKTVEDLICFFEILLSVPEKAAKVYEKRAKEVKQTQQDELSKDARQRDNRQKYQKLQRQVQELKNVNLICNRLGDLLRSKIYCNESQFIRLLELLNALNNHSIKDPFFKLIRVKDKLKQSNNNVLINYIFKGKIQCELQICFQASKQYKLIEMSNNMNHFLYELQRGVKGVVAELANIINHNDPLNLLNPSTYVVFKKLPGGAKNKKFQERQEKINHEEHQIWRCCNKYCDEFSVNGSCRFVKTNEEYYCYSCFLLKSNKHDFFTFLRMLHYQQKNQWIVNFLNNKDGVFQQIKESLFQIQNEDYKGLYLVIQPTDKKVIVQFSLIFYCKYNSAMFIKMLERKAEAKQFTSQMFKESQRMEKVILKVNKTRKFICYLESMRKEKSVEVILNKLSPSQIQNTMDQATAEINKDFLKKAIINKQANLQVNFRKSITAELQKNAKNLNFLQFFQANGLQLTTFQSFCPLPALKHLLLSNNLLQGKIILKDYPNLSKLKLNNNKIDELILQNIDNLHELNLSDNHLIQLPVDSLQNVKRLQLQVNNFQDKLSLQKLTALVYLNINHNNISQLNVSNSQHLEFLYCKKYKIHKNKTIIHFHNSAKLKEIVSIQNLIEIPNLQHSNFFQNIHKLALQYQVNIYRYVMSQTFPELKYFTIHYEQVECETTKIAEFLIRQPVINDIEFVFSSCGINQLDLRGMKKIETFTYYSEEFYFSNHPIVRLNKVQRLFVPAALEDLTFDRTELKELVANDVSTSLPLSKQLNRSCLERIDISQSNILQHYTFQNFQVLKEIKVRLLHVINQSHHHLVPKKVICHNNPLLQSIEFIAAIDQVSIKDCPEVQTVSLKCANKIVIEFMEIQLSSLQELVFTLLTITRLSLKVSSQKLKRVQCMTLVSITKEIDLSFYQNSPQLHLQELLISNRNSYSLRKLLAKVKSAKKVHYNFEATNEHLNLQTLWLGEKIETLRMIRNKQKCIDSPVTIKLNSEVTVAYLPLRVSQILLYVEVSEMMHIRCEGDKNDIAQLKHIILYRAAKGSAVVIFQVSQDILEEFKKKIDLEKSSEKLKIKFRRLAETIIDSEFD